MGLQDYGLVGIMAIEWDGSHDCSNAMDGYRPFKKDRIGRQRWSCPLWERAVRVYGALLKMDEEPAENLWERIKQQTVWMTTGCLLREAADDARRSLMFTDKPLSLWWTLTTLITATHLVIQEVPGEH